MDEVEVHAPPMNRKIHGTGQDEDVHAVRGVTFGIVLYPKPFLRGMMTQHPCASRAAGRTITLQEQDKTKKE